MHTGQEKLVNGEAVEVDVRVARVGSRALALIIDIGVQVMLVLALMIFSVIIMGLLSYGGLADDALFAAFTVIVIVVVAVVYPTAIETWTNGRSLGKRAVGLRVVREDGGPIRVRHALTRTLVGVAVEWPGLIMPLLTWLVSLFVMLFSARGRRIGDLAAGTFVVHERSAAEWGWVPAMPPHLTAWAAQLDLSGVDDALALAARHLLARQRDIAEPYLSRLTHELAVEFTERIPLPPPPGTPAVTYLTAVLAERRNRAGRHVQTGRELTERIWPGFGRLDEYPHGRAIPGRGSAI